QAPGELIYLNLPNRPRGGRDTIAPQPPARVLSRRETNIGHSGVGIYWSPGSDNNWISYYEIRRGEKLLGKASTGTYYFDHSDGWDPAAVYSVRTVDGDGNLSAWQSAEPIANEPLTAEVLGAHFPEAGREGWRAETTTDCQNFEPMHWVPRAKWPSADLGGTTIQPGGAEGYWEGAGQARVGRGWQQASRGVACVRTWTAPQSGTIRVVGRAMKDYYHRSQGGPLRIRILLGTQPVWPKDDWAVVPANDLNGVSHDFKLDVLAGETVHFVLDKGSLPEQDLLAWMPRIIYATAPSQASSPTVVRIRCGASEPYTDWDGNRWSADRCFEGGHSVAASDDLTPALGWLDDAALYQTGRAGTRFTYSIPVPPGLYCLRLKFAETQYDYFFQRPFDLSINGRSVLRNFDICQAARGPRRAYDRVFRYLVPDASGQLVLTFTGGWEPEQESKEALVQAIEVLPEEKSVIRIDAGSDRDFVDWNGYVWHADKQFEGGKTVSSEGAVEQASPTLYDQRLYQTARSGKSFHYSFNVSPGLYAVHLKFAELWLKEPGLRPMNIEINHRLVRQSWDPGQASDKLGRAADIRAEDVTPDKDGKISIQINAAGANDAILQGIEIE
ncbi:MAG: malectin, partial [Candidatus Omnitrophica bacterium]|nr:malectin [Candidatus Omnitrophota bacterium]